MMTGLFSQGRFILGSLALAAAFGFGALAEGDQASEERVIGAIFAVGLIGMLVGFGAGLFRLIFG
ncbi:MAG: hypothetical protein RQ826_17470 [Xanthomonadales bacterium]|nr:hypothetical protein [Xanthomonadales bacterium]